MTVKHFFFDLETTGVNIEKSGIVQIAGIVDVNSRAVEGFSFRVQPKPGAVIEQEALDVIGATAEEIAAYPTMASVFIAVREKLKRYCNPYNKKDKFHLTGFNNAQFDNQLLRRWWADNNDSYFGSFFWSNPVDVMTLAGVFLQDERAEMPNFKLRAVAEALGLEMDATKLHDALYDVQLTRAAYYRCMGAMLNRPTLFN